MLQIITYLLCVYLVYKGIEIYQIALCSAKENTDGQKNLGIFVMLLSIVLAIVFAYWQNMQAEGISVAG